MPPEDTTADFHGSLKETRTFPAELAGTLISEGKFDRARQVLDEMINNDPGDAHAHFLSSRLFSMTQEFENATASARAAVRFEPANTQYWNNLGHHLAAQERFEEAVAAVRKAIAIGPESGELHSTIGDLMLRLDNIPAATEAYRRSRELDPLNSHAESQLDRLSNPSETNASAALDQINAVASMEDPAKSIESTHQVEEIDSVKDPLKTERSFLNDYLETILISNTFKFGQVGGRVINHSLRLSPDGVIQGSTHPNETAWKLKTDGLVFEDDKGRPTSVFDKIDVTDEGEVRLLGRFLLDPERPYLHELKAVPQQRRFGTVVNAAASTTRPNTKVAVLVRTYKCDEKYFSLMTKLDKNRTQFDLFAIVDETRRREDPGPWPAIWHSEKDCLDLGLEQLPFGRLLRFGDFPLYVALREIPHYEYYIMVEDDVEFPENDGQFISQLCEKLITDYGSSIDLAGINLLRDPHHIWGAATQKVYADDNCYLLRFPFVVVSRRLCAYLFSQRQIEAGRNVTFDESMHCEVFAPSAAHAGGFRCVDVNEIMPGSYDRSIMLFEYAYGRPMGSIFRGRDGLRMYHPVYTVDEWVQRMRTRFATGNEASLIALVDALAEEQALAQAQDDRPMVEAIERLRGQWAPHWEELFGIERCRLSAPVEDSEQWEGIEHWQHGRGRWTRTTTTTWHFATPYQGGTRIRVLLPVLAEALPGMLENCRLRAGAVEVPMRFDAPHLVAEVTVPEGGTDEFAVLAPMVRVPEDDASIGDRRVLGLAIPLA